MPKGTIKGLGTRAKPWVLKTPSGQSEFQAFRDATLDVPALIVLVGKTELRYHLRCLTDLHAMLKKHGDWMAGWAVPMNRSPRPPVPLRRGRVRPRIPSVVGMG